MMTSEKNSPLAIDQNSHLSAVTASGSVKVAGLVFGRGSRPEFLKSRKQVTA